MYGEVVAYLHHHNRVAIIASGFVVVALMVGMVL